MNKKKFQTIAKDVINLEIKALQNLNDELQVWYQSNGKSNIYKFLLNTKD